MLNKNFKPPLMNSLFSQIGTSSTGFHQTHPLYSVLKEYSSFSKTTVFSHLQKMIFFLVLPTEFVMFGHLPSSL